MNFGNLMRGKYPVFVLIRLQYPHTRVEDRRNIRELDGVPTVELGSGTVPDGLGGVSVPTPVSPSTSNSLYSCRKGPNPETDTSRTLHSDWRSLDFRSKTLRGSRTPDPGTVRLSASRTTSQSDCTRQTTTLKNT